MSRLALFLPALSFLFFSYLPVQAQDPGYSGFYPFRYYPCSDTTRDTFHPLRPYPASPCDPYILLKEPEAPLTISREYLTFSCNNTLNLNGTYTVLDWVPRDLPAFPGDCTATLEDANGTTYAYLNYYNCGDQVCLVHEVILDFNIDLSATRLPIIGNVEYPASDAVRLNAYLDWYLNGTVYHSERRLLDATDPDDQKRISSASGPLLKQLPKNLQDNIRESIKTEPPVDTEIHDYYISVPEVESDYLSNADEDLYRFLPLTTQEDTTSEVTVGLAPAQPPSDGFIIRTCSTTRPFEIALGSDPSDSRIYFPHVRGNDALSTLLASFSLPHPTGTVDSTDTELFSREIDQHQGLDDGTLVQRYDYLTGENTRNTEIGGQSVFYPSRYRAPAPITDIEPPPFCEKSDSLTNPGDLVMGKDFNSTLIYYQHFQYTPTYRGETPPACRVEFQSCRPDECCWVEEGCEGYEPPQCTGTPTYCSQFTEVDCEWYTTCRWLGSCVPNVFCSDISDPTVCTTTAGCTWQDEQLGTCPEWPRQELASGARIGVFTKSPLVEKIYDTLVVGDQSVLRRFLPQLSGNLSGYYLDGEINLDTTVPGQSIADYSGQTADLNDPLVSGGDGNLPVDIYYDRIGSLSDHFLGDYSPENLNLQRLLRPRTTPPATSQDLAECTGTCPIPETGYCSVDDPVTQFEVNFPVCPTEASQICQAESGGDATALNDICPDYSVGLFQINLYCHPNLSFLSTPDAQTLTDSYGRTLPQILSAYNVRSCYDAWTNTLDDQYYPSKAICVLGSEACSTNTLTNPALLEACVDWFSIPQNNVAYARFISSGGTNWSPWSTAPFCGIE